MRSIVLLLLLSISALCPAQTGPGGIGDATTNFLWLDASYGVTSGTGISAWADRSGNNNNAAQASALLQPNIHANSMNGYPTVEFDNDETNYDYMVIPDNSTLEGMSGLTGFVVYRLNSGTGTGVPRCFFSKRDGVDTQEAYDWFIWNSGAIIAQHLDIDNTSHRASATTGVSTGVNNINGFTFHGAAPSNAMDQVLYDGNAAVGNRSEGSTSIPNHSSNLYIGTLRGHTGSGSNSPRFNGSMGELILYNQVLNDAQRIIVNNYLSAKYNIALASADIYLQDMSIQGNHDHDVAGIGRVNSTNIQSDSRGTGILRINGATGLDDDEFLMWGHNRGTLGTWGSTDLPPTVQGRWGRVWRASELNSMGVAVDVGAIDMTFDLNALGSITASDIRLLVDSDNDGVFADETPISGATSLGSGLHRFSGITAITNNTRFTLGTINSSQTPLPIELISFAAQVEGRNVRAAWSTATEHDNAWFVVQRSTDAVSWTAVGELPGAGNSVTVLNYTFMDLAVPAGTFYYRLKQLDVDGTSTVSPTVAVKLDPDADLIVFPNPTHDRFQVMDRTGSAIVLLDVMGRVLSVPMERQTDRTSVDVSGSTPGIYLVQAGGRTCRVVVE